MTVLSSLLARCRPWWENLWLRLPTQLPYLEGPLILRVESTTHAIRASFLAIATISTFRGTRISSAVNHAPMATLFLTSRDW